MAVTLAEAKNNTQDDLDVTVIDEFAKSSDILSRITFDDSTSPTGGDTLTYSYRRLLTQRSAAFRELNTEYGTEEVTTKLHNVELKPLGGAFNIDRVIAKLGPAASGQVVLQMNQLIKASAAKFSDAVINGDTANEANGFDGLSKILTGSTTEYLPLNNGVASGYVNWTTISSLVEALDAMVHIDNWLSTLNGTPDVIYGNSKTLNLFKRIAALAGQLDKTTDSFGRPVTHYNGIALVDLGAKAGSNDPVVGLVSRDADGAGAGAAVAGLGDLYAVRYSLDGFHGAAVSGGSIISTFLPDFSTPLAVKRGEAELGPVAPVLRASKAAAVFRNIKSA